jgi:hypothetical protein
VNSRTLIVALLCVAALGVIVFLARHNQRTLTASLPPRIVCADQADAQRQAGPTAIAVLGTGSMAPFIPAALSGLDPFTTVVAYAVPSPDLVFGDIKAGRLVVYAPSWSPKFSVMHLAASQDAGGWIMSGLANRDYEASERVTREKFRAIVSAVYVWPQ